MASVVREALDELMRAAGDGRLDAVSTELGVRVLGVFGSAVDPRSDPNDLDISVWFETDSHALELLDRLVEITGTDRIDLLDLGRAEPVARARGLTGIGLFEAEPGQWATTQMAALAQERDTEHLRELDRQALAR